MRLRAAAALFAALIALSFQQARGQTQDDLRAEIDQIKAQLAEMEQLKARLTDLEKRIAETPPAQNQPVTTSFPGAKARIDGRVFVGAFDSGDQGQFPDWSTDINDAKLRLTFNPSDRITIVNRLSSTGARSAEFDYFYLDYARLTGAATLRVGQRKIDVGQETWTDNPVENMLISNSVPHVSGYGTGVAVLGRLGTQPNAPLFEAGFVNGPRGVMSRPTSGLPLNLKIGVSLTDRIFSSASYFDSGRLRGTDNTSVSVAEIAGPPSGATEWTRRIWEVDLRYNYGSTGMRSVVPYGSMPGLMLAAAYGQFDDNAVGIEDRRGTFWYLEGLRSLSPRLYAAARYSTVRLDNGITARLARSPVPVNEYNRTSLGLGYKLTDLTVLKAEYSINNTFGSTEDPSLDQWAVGIASKF